jgi:hypothetical protein
VYWQSYCQRFHGPLFQRVGRPGEEVLEPGAGGSVRPEARGRNSRGEVRRQPILGPQAEENTTTQVVTKHPLDTTVD